MFSQPDMLLTVVRDCIQQGARERKGKRQNGFIFLGTKKRNSFFLDPKKKDPPFILSSGLFETQQTNTQSYSISSFSCSGKRDVKSLKAD